jgi:hypothetical protein
LNKAEYSQAQIAGLLARRYSMVQPRFGMEIWQQVEALIRQQWRGDGSFVD